MLVVGCWALTNPRWLKKYDLASNLSCCLLFSNVSYCLISGIKASHQAVSMGAGRRSFVGGVLMFLGVSADHNSLTSERVRPAVTRGRQRRHAKPRVLVFPFPCRLTDRLTAWRLLLLLPFAFLQFVIRALSLLSISKRTVSIRAVTTVSLLESGFSISASSTKDNNQGGNGLQHPTMSYRQVLC